MSSTMKAPNNHFPNEIWMHRNDDGSLDLSVFMRSKSRDTDICYVQIDKVEKEASDIEGGMIDIIIEQYDDVDKANEIIRELVHRVEQSNIIIQMMWEIFKTNTKPLVINENKRILTKAKEFTDE